jgi:hypothetical protein
MNYIIKCFLTYSSISMFSAMVYFILNVLDIIETHRMGIFVILWMGPLVIAGSIGGPYLLYRLWREK